MSEQSNEEAISDPVAAAAARAELAAAAERLRRVTGWTDEPPERPGWLVYKTCATDEQRVAHRRAVIARARKLVARLDAQQRVGLVYKIYTPPPSQQKSDDRVIRKPYGAIDATSVKIEPIAAESTTMTETTKPESPFEVLAGELGMFAGRMEKETILKFKNLKAELELDLERRLNEQSREIAELRGQLAVLLSDRGVPPPRTARAARADKPTDFDFNEVRAATRN